jgi:sulfate-transporting ATPase
MSEFLQYAVLGLGAGAAYTLLGAGVVLINRGAGVVNFAQAAMAMLAALIFYSLSEVDHLSLALALIFSVLSVAVLGALTFLLIMRPLGSGSPVARTIVTLGLLILLPGVAALIWGVTPISVSTFLPQNTFKAGSVVISEATLILFGIALVLTIALWAHGRFTAMGLAFRALSENPRAASTLGWSPVILGTLTWAGGAGLAAVAGILLAPISPVTVGGTPLLIIPVLAAVLLGGFQSFPILFLASIIIGIGQSLSINYVSVTGLNQALPFAIIVIFLVIRGRAVLTRSNIVERLPQLGSGRVPWPWLGLFSGGMIICLIWVFSVNLQAAIIQTAGWALIVLSIVVLTGFSGQLSLAQVALAGIAALVSARLAVNWSFPFPLALVGAVICTVIVGLAFAIPALRTRGINLAIVTLGLASVTSEMVFNNSYFAGSSGTITIPSPSLFGLNVDPNIHTSRYAVMAFLIFVLCALIAAAIRRGTAGGRLIAVRTNERAAAALGIDVVGAKFFSFGLAAALAGVGGVVLAFANSAIDLTIFVPLQSVTAVAYGIVGGVGYVVGAAGGATYAPGAFGNWILNEFAPSASALWLQVISGAALILLVVLQPDGMARDWARQAKWLARKVGRARPRRAEANAGQDKISDPLVKQMDLVVDNISVHFGSVKAVDELSFEVHPGEVMALIGPNGAGKTTCIDALTGFVYATGSVRLNNKEVSRLSAFRRSRLGMSRSFQSLELFESLTVRENLLAGADKGRTRDYFRDLVWPKRPTLGPLASAAVREFKLAEHFDTQVGDLPYGERRLVAVARALASEPSVLLLDEPAAGLGQVEVREFERVIRRLASWGMTIVLIEHDMRLIMGVSDRISVLETGRFLAGGTPAEIRENPDVIRAYLGNTASDKARPTLPPAKTATLASSPEVQNI